MPIAEYSDYDGLALADLVDRGEVTPPELVEEAVTRIEKHNGVLNAVIFKAFDDARARAKESLPDGPFKGVPFLLKDILGDMKGWPTTHGTAFLKDYRPEQNSELVNRFLAAGMVPLGKTVAPEIGALPVSEPRLYGPARNPWNTEHTPGGSSGGSAAAVAAGIVPVAHANDGGGSIRIPASCCGVVGLKPTRMRNPRGPVLGDVMGGLVEEHIVSRTVRDTAAMLDATAGPDVGAPYAAPPQAASYRDIAARDPSRLRIAYSVKNMRSGNPLHPDCVAAVEETAALCADLGHTVEEADLPVDGAMFAQLFTVLWCAYAGATLDGFALMAGKPLEKADFEPFTWALHEAGKAINAPDFLLAEAYTQMTGRAVGRFFQNYDLFITATLGEPPLKVGRLDTNTDKIEDVFGPIADYVVSTPLANATGNPSVSLPLHWNANGLPIGVLVTGALGDDAAVLALAGQLERARPWKDRKPKVWG